MDKKNYLPPYDNQLDKVPWEGDQPLSKDWQYYKKVAEDPEFDKEQGKKSNIRYFWCVIVTPRTSSIPSYIGSFVTPDYIGLMMYTIVYWRSEIIKSF